MISLEVQNNQSGEANFIDIDYFTDGQTNIETATTILQCVSL